MQQKTRNSGLFPYDSPDGLERLDPGTIFLNEASLPETNFDVAVQLRQTPASKVTLWDHAGSTDLGPIAAGTHFFDQSLHFVAIAGHAAESGWSGAASRHKPRSCTGDGSGARRFQEGSSLKEQICLALRGWGMLTCWGCVAEALQTTTEL